MTGEAFDAVQKAAKIEVVAAFIDGENDCH